MLFSPLLAAQAALSTLNHALYGSGISSGSAELATRTIYELAAPLSAENLLERANGNILISTQGGPHLVEVDPRRNQSGEIVYTFSGHQNAFGIAEGEQDVFYVLAANYTHAPTWTGIQGSNALYEVNMSGHCISVSKVVDIHEAYTLDGLLTINREKGLLLAGDTQTGTLYLFDVKKRQYTAVYQSELLNQTAKHIDVQLDRVGVNGIKYYDGNLYFTDTSRHSFGRLPLDASTGWPTGEAVDLAYFNHHPDDFSISSAGVAVITILEQGFVMMDVKNPKRTSGTVTVLQDYVGANAALWGRTEDTRCTFYATYNMGVVSGTDVSSGLIAMDTTGWGLTAGC